MKLQIVLLVSLLACGAQQEKDSNKINGLCVVAPPHEIKSEHYEPILQTNANWVAIIPYAFCSPNRPTVTFDHSSQWYGETTAGITQAVNLAHQAGLKVMLKPHLWVPGQGWAGDLEFTSEQDLKIWMHSYTKYIRHFSQLAESLEVEMVSIGTEVRQIAKSNPDYWKSLIKTTKAVFSGPITYSANWDNYQNIAFWEDLDYIGIDAYFPTGSSKTPTVEELLPLNEDLASQLRLFSESHLKKVLFTEYGFKSSDFCTAGHWETDDKNHNINSKGQANAYAALFQTYWKENWFAGGFAWKWHYKHATAGGIANTEFTPQNKLAEKILKNQYSKNTKQ